MIPLDRHDLTLLYVLKDATLLKKAISVSKKGADLFPYKLRPHLSLLWTTYLSKMVANKKVGRPTTVDIDDFVATALERLKDADMGMENKARLQAICERLREEKPIDADIAKEYLKETLNEATQRALSTAVVSSSSFDAIRKLVLTGTDMESAVTEDSSAHPLYVNPLMCVEKYLKKVPKRPTGVAHFDKVTAGGMSPGEVCLLAGLMGSGKTMNTIQIVGSQLLMANAVMWATYEQPFDQDLMQRMVSFLTGYELDNIRGTEFQDLPQNVQERFNAVTSSIKDKLIAVDFSNNDMLDREDSDDDASVYSIRKRLKMAKESGVDVQYLVVDWLGAAVKNIAAQRGIDIGVVTNYIAIANELLTDLVQLGKDFSVPIIVFHQLDPSIKKSPPSRKPTSVELQFIKSAANWVDYAIVMGKQDDNHRCWFICDKCRKSYPSECVIEMDGAHARFKLLNGYAPGRNGQFINISEIQQEERGEPIVGAATNYKPII